MIWNFTLPDGVGVLPSFLIFLNLLVSSSLGEISRYYTYEEDAPGTVIGVLSEDLLFNSADRPTSSFRPMKQQNNPLIRVRESDGQLSIGERIDREEICSQSLHCVLAFDVVTFSKDQFKLLHVEVEVRDINDNSPHFPRAEISLDVWENAVLGTRIPLEVAVDEDVGLNSIQSFQISANSHFSLEVQTRADGVIYADLVLMKDLDRETQAAYTIEMVAKDGGSPARSGSAVISVRVLDVNDNSPMFDQNSYTVDLTEDSPLGFLLLDLNAVDPDEGMNGDIIYDLSPQVSPEVRQVFQIDPKSGRLTLTGPLDFEVKETYELDVQAQDLGVSYLTATCKVIVHIKDVNDNAPAISITPLTSISAGVAYITEAAAADSFVALISTSDSDSGPSGQVRCTLHGHEHFKLQQAYEDSYMIVTSTALDREKIPEYNLTVVAEDLGSPPFKTIRHYTIRVSDENDNAPLFTRAVYEVSVLENNAPGAYITTVVARDPDLGHNGKVNYRLLEAEVIGSPASSLVFIDLDTGALHARNSFDYEGLKQLELEIQASDGGSPQLSSRALVKITIVDQNDNAPVFTFPPLRNQSADMLLPIRAPTNYLITQIKAKDADEGVNSDLSYAILQDNHRLFAINKVTGELSLRRRLGEDFSHSLAVVIAVSDHGRPFLSCTATINFILTETAPSSEHIVVIESTEGHQQDWNFSIIFIAVLAGGCGLLVFAIIIVASTYWRKSSDFERDSEQPERCKGSMLLKSPVFSESDSSTGTGSQPDSCQLSINTESEDCNETSHSDSKESVCFYMQQEGVRRSNSKNSASVPLHPVSDWQEGKSSLTFSSSNPDEFSMKDSGKGDSDFNDSDSDFSGEGFKKQPEQSSQKPGGYPIHEAGSLYSNEGSCHQPPKNKDLPPQCGRGNMIAYCLTPVYQHASQHRKHNVHLHHLKSSNESYHQVSIPKTERSQSSVENRGPSSSIQSSKEGANVSGTIFHLSPSEVATSF
ncbi:protocadherin-8-like [Microcaecilia unicolor]|uniref:Protocadherin-8 n=1 Tax=Microcaecilia unicolor TaxID=1415580 RepID=A0A6P7Y697_9AMPH|nr:protocadherin-8-like [Microcaecilia unicolor]